MLVYLGKIDRWEGFLKECTSMDFKKTRQYLEDEEYRKIFVHDAKELLNFLVEIKESGSIMTEFGNEHKEYLKV